MIMADKEKKFWQLETVLPVHEELAYIGAVLFTLGTVWIIKLIIKKAIIEAIERTNE